MSSHKNALAFKLIPVLGLLTLAIPAAVCQLNSNTASVALRATLGESLTVAATPSTVAIPLVSGGTAPLGAAGAGLTLFTQALSGTNRNANRTDNLNLEINLASQPLLPAGTYTGTLNIQAQAL